MKRAVLLSSAVFFLPFCFFPSGVPAGTLDIWCVSGGDSGAGTGTVIQGPDGTVVLFDEGGGANWAAACNALLASLGIYEIDHAIASHYDLDHIGGLDELLETTGVVKFWDRGGNAKQDGSPIDPTYLNIVEGEDRNTVKVDGTTDIDLGDGAMIRFLSVGAADNKDTGTDNRTFIRGRSALDPAGTENNKSISALVSYCCFDFYVGGDAEGGIEKAVDDVIIDDLDRRVDVLHVDHHGSDTNDTNSAEFLWRMGPAACVTSVWNNSSGLPKETTMSVLDELVDQGVSSNIRLRTGSGAAELPKPPRYTAEGHIHIYSNCTEYSIEGLPNEGYYMWPMLGGNRRYAVRVGYSRKRPLLPAAASPPPQCSKSKKRCNLRISGPGLRQSQGGNKIDRH